MNKKWIKRGLCLILAILMVSGVIFSALPVSATSKSSKTKEVVGIDMAPVKGYPKIVFYDAEGEAIKINGETELDIADKNLSFSAHELTYELSKSSRIKRNYSHIDLILGYADTSYPLIPSATHPGTYTNAPLKDGARAYINYDGYEFASDEVEFGISSNKYLIVKAYFNDVDFFNTYENRMTVSFEYSRADGSSVSGGDDYRIVNLETPDRYVPGEDDEEDEDEDWDDSDSEGDVTFGDGDDETTEDENDDATTLPGISPVDINSSTPYVIVEEYSFAGGSTQVAAGSDFNLNLSCRNTHAKIDLENVIMKVTATDGLQLTSSSNTFFMDRIKRSAGFEKDLNVSALSNAEAKSYILKIDFTYEYIADGARKKGEMSQEISIPVVQTDRFSADPITEVSEMTVGDEIDIVSKFMNKSRGQLYNLTATLECDESINCDEKIQHSGNLQAGASGEMEFALMGSMPGTFSCTVVYSYEDAMGNVKETRVPFDVTFIEAPTFEWDQPVMEEFPMDDVMYDEFGNPIDPMAAEEGLTQNQKLLIAAGAAVVLVVAAVIIRKRKKAKEFEDDDENF